MRRELFIDISSPQTCSLPNGDTGRTWILAWRSLRRRQNPLRPDLARQPPQKRQRIPWSTSPVREQRWARSRTCHPSKLGGRNWTHEPTYFPLARCCTKWQRVHCPSEAILLLSFSMRVRLHITLSLSNHYGSHGFTTGTCVFVKSPTELVMAQSGGVFDESRFARPC